MGEPSLEPRRVLLAKKVYKGGGRKEAAANGVSLPCSLSRGKQCKRRYCGPPSSTPGTGDISRPPATTNGLLRRSPASRSREGRGEAHGWLHGRLPPLLRPPPPPLLQTPPPLSLLSAGHPIPGRPFAGQG